MRLGLIGVGHLGKIHLKCIKQIPEIELVGFYDTNETIRSSIESEFDVRAFEDLDELMDAVDAVDVVTTTPMHYSICKKALEHDIHVFVEKPVCAEVDEAEDLMQLMQTKPSLKFQVGHVERFNPAFLALNSISLDPKFIEVHRLANFNPRSTDVSVIHDLMIHDLDIILHLVKSKVVDIKAKGVNIISSKADICNARIEFENGCVANVTSSRLSIKNMRKMRIFQEDAYVSVDFLEKNAEIIKLADEASEHSSSVPIESSSGNKYIEIHNPQIESVNAILEELKSFYASISQDKSVIVGIEDGLEALRVAELISVQMDSNPNLS